MHKDELAAQVWSDIGDNATGDMSKFAQLILDAHTLAIDVAEQMEGHVTNERASEVLVWFLLHHCLHDFIGQMVVAISQRDECFKVFHDMVRQGMSKNDAAHLMANMLGQFGS